MAHASVYSEGMSCPCLLRVHKQGRGVVVFPPANDDDDSEEDEEEEEVIVSGTRDTVVGLVGFSWS